MIRLLAENYIRFPANSPNELWLVVASISFTIAVIFVLKSEKLAIATAEALRTAKDWIVRGYGDPDLSENRLFYHPDQRIIEVTQSKCFLPEAIQAIFVRSISSLNSAPLLKTNNYFAIGHFGMISSSLFIEWHQKHQYHSLSDNQNRNSDYLDDSDSDFRRHDERLQLALDATVDGIWDWNFKENKFFWSKRVYEILGLSRLKNGQQGKDLIFSRIDPANRKNLLKIVENPDRSPPTLRIELRMRYIYGC